MSTIAVGRTRRDVLGPETGLQEVTHLAERFSNPTQVEPTKVDMAASQACGRSGAFALLLSVALLLMVPSWLEQPNYAALRLYLAYRLSLASEVDRLDDDPLWQKFKTAHESA